MGYSTPYGGVLRGKSGVFATAENCVYAVDIMKPEHEKFCYELVKRHMDKIRAYQAVYGNDISDKVAATAAGRLLKNVEIIEKVSSIAGEAFSDLQIEANDVARLLWDTVTADPNELVEIRRDCCRYCYGIDHLYQYTPAEWDAVWHRYQQDYNAAVVNNKPVPREPSVRGGIGFNRRMPPNPSCPECHGEGVEDIFIKDTRDLSPAARQLYAGVKTSKNGIEIKMHSRDKAIELMGRYLAMFTDNVDHKNNGGSFEPMSLDQFYGNRDDSGTDDTDT